MTNNAIAANAANRERGFTLIELMVVVAMVAILATLALNSYQGATVRANRAAAAGYVLEVANLQERFLLDNRDYAASMAALGAVPPSEVSSNYTITTSDPGGAAPAYLITATPIGSHDANDTQCGILTLNNLGVRTTEFGGDRCWR